MVKYHNAKLRNDENAKMRMCQKKIIRKLKHWGIQNAKLQKYDNAKMR